jgi:hypothetical protein
MDFNCSECDEEMNKTWLLDLVYQESGGAINCYWQSEVVSVACGSGAMFVQFDPFGRNTTLGVDRVVIVSSAETTFGAPTGYGPSGIDTNLKCLEDNTYTLTNTGSEQQCFNFPSEVTVSPVL